MNNTLTLVRGLPGSGKSTWVEKEVRLDNRDDDCARHLEADMYFIRNGKYVFDKTKLRDAHRWCQETTRIMLEQGFCAYVSNTFTQIWEMKPYLNMAKEMGIEVRVIRCTGEYGSIHEIPEETLKAMKDRFEDYEGEVNV